MAINVQYGNIADALGLAQMAGKNQGDQQRFKNFTQFAQLTQEAQDAIDRKNASAIQNSLASDQANQHFQLAQDQLQAENQRVAAQQSLAAERSKSEDAFRQQELGIRKTNSENEAAYHTTRAGQFDRQQNRADENVQNKEAAIANLPPDAQDVVRATGRMPWRDRSFSPNADDQLEARLRDQLGKAIDREAKHTYRADDPNQMMEKPSSGSPAIAGREAQYMQAQNDIAAIHAQMDALAQRRQQQAAMASPVQAGTQGLNAAAVVRNAAPSQPGAQGAPQAPPQGPGSQTMPVHVSSAQDYAQLQSGSYYIDPNGQTRQKL
jgi:hypothetical protein